MKDPANMIPFSAEESMDLVAAIKPLLLADGLIARADGRGAPILQYSPPLIAGADEFDEIARISRRAIDAAWKGLSA